MDGFAKDTELINDLVAFTGLAPAAVAKKAGVAASTVNRPYKGTAQTRLGRAVLDKLQAAFPDFPGWATIAPRLTDDRLRFRGAEHQSERLLPHPELRNPPVVAPREKDDLVQIDKINMAYGLGGTFIDNEVIEAEKVTFSRSWLRAYTHSAPELLFTTDGVGDSMEPTISDHDVVICDRGQVRLDQVKSDKLWACIFGGVGMIKRLRPMPDGRVRIMSDNQLVRDDFATDGDLHIVGRVVAVVKRH